MHESSTGDGLLKASLAWLLEVVESLGHQRVRASCREEGR